jgi:hypothetical protein
LARIPQQIGGGKPKAGLTLGEKLLRMMLGMAEKAKENGLSNVA